MYDDTPNHETLEDEAALSRAVENGDWNRARHLAAIKVAQMMEKTDSPRETKALAISLTDLIDECEQADVTDARDNSEIGRILKGIRTQAVGDGKVAPPRRRYIGGDDA